MTMRYFRFEVREPNIGPVELFVDDHLPREVWIGMPAMGTRRIAVADLAALRVFLDEIQRPEPCTSRFEFESNGKIYGYPCRRVSGHGGSHAGDEPIALR